MSLGRTVLGALLAIHHAVGCTASTGEVPSAGEPGAEGGLRVCEGEQVVQSVAELQGLASCTVIGGSLHVEGVPGAIDLAPLSNLIRVDGDLVVSGLDLQTLQGLESLRYVRGWLYVDTGEALERVVLPSLADVDLVEVVGIAGIEIGLPVLHGTRSLRVEGTGLRLLDLPALVAVSEDVTVEGAEQLEALSLPVLSDVGDLTLRHLPSLASLSAPELSTLGGLTLHDTALRDLAGLADALRVDRVTLQDNPLLTDVDALADWDGLTRLEVWDNAALRTLPEAEVDTLHLTGDALEEIGPLFVNNKLVLERLPMLDPSGVEVDTTLSELVVSGVHRASGLDFLAGLESVSNALTIVDNAALVDLTGLESLAYTCQQGTTGVWRTPPLLCEGLQITANPVLTDVSALSALVGGGATFVDNTSLCDDDLVAFLEAHACPYCAWDLVDNGGC